jgi:phosphoglycolate phosphatase
MAIRGILFDKDGTLIDVDRTWLPIYREMLQHLFATDEAGAEALMEQVGYDKATDRMKPGSLMAGGTTAQMVDVWWPNLDAAGKAEKSRAIDNDYTHLVEARLQPLMPLTPIMEELKAMGHRVGLATNDSYVSAVRHMELVGLSGHFEMILSYDTVPRAKPSGDMIRAFAAKTGLAPKEIAIVGDNSHDLEEAQNGGAGLAIGVLTGNSQREHLAQLADHVIGSVAELPALMRSL